MFFQKCSYVVSLCYSNDLQLEIQKRCSYLWCCFRFCAFGFETISHPSCSLTSIMAKTHHGLFIAPFFLCNFCSFFGYVGGVLVTNLFSLLLIDRYILAIEQIITREEHLWYSFWSVAFFWTASEALAPWS